MLNAGSECLPGCEVTCSQPCAYSRSLEPCVASCGDSRAVVFPPPVVITFPGPTLSTCSQESVVGASHPMVLGAPMTSISDESWGVGGTAGAGGSFGSGGSFGYGGSSGIGGLIECGGAFPPGVQNSFGSRGYGGSLGAAGSSYSRRSYSGRRGSRLGNWGSS